MTILVYVLAAVTVARLTYLLDLAHGERPDVNGRAAAALLGLVWPFAFAVVLYDTIVDAWKRARRAGSTK